MTHKRSILRLFTPVAAALMLACASACSDDNDYTYIPGEKPAENCPEVYFDASNPAETMFTPQESARIVLTLGRRVAEGALTVPVTVVSKGEGLTIPENVTFAEGEDHTELVIDASGVAAGVPQSFTLAIPEEYVNHYAQTPGSSTYAGKAICAEWKLISDNVTFEFETRYQPMTGSLYELEGIGRYMIPNFLNTGLDLLFTMENSKSDGAYRTIDPYKNADIYMDTDAGYSYWYFYDSDNDEWPLYVIEEGTPAITYMEFFGVDFGTDYYYTYICPDYNSGMFGGLFYYDDIPNGEFNNVTFYW